MDIDLFFYTNIVLLLPSDWSSKDFLDSSLPDLSPKHEFSHCIISTIKVVACGLTSKSPLLSSSTLPYFLLYILNLFSVPFLSHHNRHHYFLPC